MDMIDIKDIFAERLMDLMEEKSLNSVQLSKLVNIPRTSISNWLNKKRLVQVDALIKFAQFFNVTTDFLLGRED